MYSKLTSPVLMFDVLDLDIPERLFLVSSEIL